MASYCIIVYWSENACLHKLTEKISVWRGKVGSLGVQYHIILLLYGRYSSGIHTTRNSITCTRILAYIYIYRS